MKREREREDQTSQAAGGLVFAACSATVTHGKSGEMFVGGACWYALYARRRLVVSAGENEKQNGRPLIGLRLHHHRCERPVWAPVAPTRRVGRATTPPAGRCLSLSLSSRPARPPAVHILGREAGSAAAAQPLPHHHYYCCCGRGPREIS